MLVLEEYERQQSGVQAILREVQEQQETLKMICTRPHTEDPVQDAHRTQWYRAQFAILSYLVDKIGGLGDTGEDVEGIGAAALPPSQE